MRISDKLSTIRVSVSTHCYGHGRLTFSGTIISTEHRYCAVDSQSYSSLTRDRLSCPPDFLQGMVHAQQAITFSSSSSLNPRNLCHLSYISSLVVEEFSKTSKSLCYIFDIQSIQIFIDVPYKVTCLFPYSINDAITGPMALV